MKVDLYERIWLWMATVMIVAFLAAVLIAAGTHAVHPPSHMETIDPATVLSDSEFARELGVIVHDDGSATVRMVAKTYVFEPRVVRVPAGEPVTFRMTSPDVIHGFQVVGTNANAMVVPGYVTQFTTSFAPGEYLVLCNEYCGLSHHLMQSTLIVDDRAADNRAAEDRAAEDRAADDATADDTTAEVTR
ncbi:MAG: cytochrome C oxidase subunit II [Acidobacteriota bacterium]